MGTESVPAAPALTGRQDRRPGWIDRLVALVDGLPGPAAVWFIALAASILVATHLIAWVSGAVPVGTVEPESVAPTILFVYFAWFLHALNGVARSAYDEFRPALGGTAEEQERYRAELTSIPDRIGLVVVLIIEIIVNGAYFGTVRPLRPALPFVVELVSGVIWALVAATVALLIVHTVRQLHLVSRLSTLARNVDIFKPAPINAFSRLTAVSASGILVFVGLFVLLSPEQPVAFVAQEIGLIGLAIASFVLPLRVMHARLVDEKRALFDAMQDRLKTTMARVHATVDADDLKRADELQKTLTSLLAERDVLIRLPTWPWSAGTFRGFASAVVLPIIIWLVIRVLERVL